MSCELYLDQKISTPLFFNGVTLPSQLPQLRKQRAPPATPPHPGVLFSMHMSCYTCWKACQRYLETPRGKPAILSVGFRQEEVQELWSRPWGVSREKAVPRGVSVYLRSAVRWGAAADCFLSTFKCSEHGRKWDALWRGCPPRAPLQHHPHGCCLLISWHKGGSRQSLLLPLPKGADSRTGSPGGGQSRRMMAVLSDTPASFACRQLQSASLLDNSVWGVFVLETAGGGRPGD